jgi:hypothetical protein
MVYTRNQPVASDDLDISQPFLTNNTNGADDSFGIDHYKFSDLTANNGFHNKVTTPQFLTSPPSLPSVPPTTTTNPIFYGYQQLDGSGVPTNNLGLLQYSRGPTNAVPTPVTYLQSPVTPIVLTPGSTTNVFNFAGLTQALAVLYASDFIIGTNIDAFVTWNGTTLTVGSSGTVMSAVVSGSILQLKSNASSGNLTSVAWTLQFVRILQ